MKILFTLSIIFLIFLYGCLNKCEEPETAYNVYFLFDVRDKINKKSLLNQYCSLLNVKQENALSWSYNDFMAIDIADEKTDSLNKPISKTYFLHFIDSNMVETDIDTLIFSYEIYSTLKCRYYDFKYFNCYYNNKLYFSDYPWGDSFYYFYK